MIRKARALRFLRGPLLAFTAGYLGNAIWMNPPVSEFDAIFVFVFIVIITILHFVEQAIY